MICCFDSKFKFFMWNLAANNSWTEGGSADFVINNTNSAGSTMDNFHSR